MQTEQPLQMPATEGFSNTPLPDGGPRRGLYIFLLMVALYGTIKLVMWLA